MFYHVSNCFAYSGELFRQTVIDGIMLKFTPHQSFPILTKNEFPFSPEQI